MKKLFALALAAMMALCLVCSASAETPTYKLGILAPETTHGWVGGVLYYAQQAVAELDNVDATLLTSSNAEEMSSQIEQLISLGVDAIVVWPQFTGVETAAELALSKGIVIANFDMIFNVSDEYADNMMLDEAYQNIWVSSATYAPSMIIDTIEMAVKVLSGEEVEHLVVIPTTIVDRDNVAEYLDEKTPY